VTYICSKNKLKTVKANYAKIKFYCNYKHSQLPNLWINIFNDDLKRLIEK